MRISDWSSDVCSSDLIKTIGLFNTKAKNVIALSKALIADHDGKVPADRDALEKLPGVGRKTANVVMNVAFDQETFAVDTHIFRISKDRKSVVSGKSVSVRVDLVGSGLFKKKKT